MDTRTGGLRIAKTDGGVVHCAGLAHAFTPIDSSGLKVNRRFQSALVA